MQEEDHDHPADRERDHQHHEQRFEQGAEHQPDDDGDADHREQGGDRHAGGHLLRFHGLAAVEDEESRNVLEAREQLGLHPRGERQGGQVAGFEEARAHRRGPVPVAVVDPGDRGHFHRVHDVAQPDQFSRPGAHRCLQQRVEVAAGGRVELHPELGRVPEVPMFAGFETVEGGAQGPSYGFRVQAPQREPLVVQVQFDLRRAWPFVHFHLDDPRHGLQVAGDLERDPAAHLVLVGKDVHGDRQVGGGAEELRLVEDLDIVRYRERFRQQLDPLRVGVGTVELPELHDQQRLVVRLAEPLLQRGRVLVADPARHDFDVARGDLENLLREVHRDGLRPFERRPGRGRDLDHQAVGVVLREQDEGDQRPHEGHDRREGDERGREGRHAMPEHPRQRPPVEGFEHLHETPFGDVGPTAQGGEVRGQDEERLEQGEDHDDHHDGGDLPRDLARQAAEHGQGKKGEHGRHRGSRHRRQHLARPGERRARRRQPLGPFHDDAFGDHHRIVDHHAQHDDEAGQCQEVQRHAERTDEDQRGHEDHGNAHQDPERRARPDEQEQHATDEQDANQPVGEHQVEPVLNHDRFVVDGFGLDRAAERSPGEHALHLRHRVDDVDPHPLFHEQHDTALAIAVHDQARIRPPALDPRNVGDPERPGAGPEAQDRLADVGGIFEPAPHDDLTPFVRALQYASGARDVAPLHRGDDLGQRHAMFPGKHRIHQDAHLRLLQADRDHFADRVEAFQAVFELLRRFAQRGFRSRQQDLDDHRRPRIELQEGRLVFHFRGEVRDAVHRGAQVDLGRFDAGGVVVVVELHRGE